MCDGVRALPLPPHSWLGCAVWLCVLRFRFRVRPAILGLGSGLCVLLCALCLYLANPRWGVRCLCVCFGWASAAPRETWLGFWGLCVCGCVPPLPRQSWLWCAVWVCVRRLGFWLYPANPGWGVRFGCLFWGPGLGCAPPFLASVLSSVF